MKKNLKTRMMPMLLGAAVVLGTMTLPAAAQAEVADGVEIVETELQQTGVVADLTISNARELNEFAQKVNNGNSYEGKVIKLTNDIAFDGVTVNNFTPIGSGSYSFRGTFDGCGYTISGIDVTNASDAALFDCVSGGEIKNVTLKNCSFSGTYDAAGIVTCLSSGMVSNCHVINCEITQSHTYGRYAGGIATYIYSGAVVKNCSSNSNVVNESVSGFGTGGIVGKCSGNDLIVNSCNTGSVTGVNDIGGVCGDLSGTIQNCFNTGKVTGRDRYVGGIVGFGNSSSIVANSYTSESAYQTNFGSMNGKEKGCKAYTDSYMRSAQFLNQLNSNRGSNTDWFRWELRSDSVYPLPVKTTNIANCNVGLAKGNCTYNGKAQTPAVSITNGSYKLVKDVDYAVSYQNNVNVGTAKAVISGTGMYTGEVTVSFTIQKGNPAISYKTSITKTYGAKAFSLGAKVTSGGSKLTYKTSNAKVATVNSKGTVTIKGVGKANITITCPASGNYNSRTVTTAITVKPKKQSAGVKVSGSKMKITWNKDSRVSGYQVQYANNKSFNKNCKTITVKKKGKTSYTVKKLKKKTKYYVRVRSYKTVNVNGKQITVNGAWSKAKKVSR